MGFFSKRKDENNGFIINTDDEPIKISGDQNLAPHAMTPDEVSNLWIFGDDESNVTQTGALDSLKKRMNVSATVPQSEESKEPASKPNSNNLDKTAQHIDNQEDNSHKTLVEKVKRYTIDEHGKDASENNEPLYHLESVAEILMSDGESAMKSLSEKYGIDINNTDTNSEEPTKPSISEKTNSAIKPTVAFEKMVIESEKRETQELFDNLFTDNKKLEEIPDASVPNISDIDNKEVGITTPSEMSNTATIRFTPVKDTKGNTDHITISSSTRHIDLGEDYVEDISSQLCVSELDLKENYKLIDVCSAPGGKSFTASQYMNNTGVIYSCDIHPHRVELIKSGVERLGLKNIKPTLSDATVFNDEFTDADAVLCDVPCSGLGIIGKKPEIKYKSLDDTKELIPIQKQILSTASQYVKSGGVLVYSTCSVNPNENRKVCDWFLKENPDFKSVKVAPKIERCIDEGDYLTLTPHINNCDGFFIAKFIKK